MPAPTLPPMPAPMLIGVDFTSTPRAGKPITVAIGRLVPGTAPRVHLAQIAHFRSLDDWLGWLCMPQAWVGAFDFPFGLPRAFAAGLGWPLEGVEPWVPVTQRLAALSRAELVAHCRAWCDARPPGSKFAHRATDRPAGSSPSMKWVNPPVALMLHEGAPRLLQAGVTLPVLRRRGTDPARVALEGYPALLARALLGRASYKSDEPARRHCPARRAAREQRVAALETGAHPLGTAVSPAAERGAPATHPHAEHPAVGGYLAPARRGGTAGPAAKCSG